MGTIYLIHFNEPIGNLSNPHGQAQHYMGYTDDLVARIERHRAGSGAAIMAAVKDYEVGWRLARTWEGDRGLERKLKDQKNHPRLCPICKREEVRGNVRGARGIDRELDPGTSPAMSDKASQGGLHRE